MLPALGHVLGMQLIRALTRVRMQAGNRPPMGEIHGCGLQSRGLVVVACAVRGLTLSSVADGEMIKYRSRRAVRW